jgi:hypothetical protein
MRQLSNPLLITSSDIAALAQVKPAVVPTWRRRHKDFPDPVAGNGRGLWFDGRQVANWLITTGRGNTEPGQVRAELALHGIAQYTNDFGPLPLIEIVGGLLCLRHLDQRPLVPDQVADLTPSAGAVWEELARRVERVDAEDEFALSELRAADSSAAPLAFLAEDLVEASYGTEGAFERLLGAAARLGVVELASNALAPELERLLVQVADLPSRMGQQGMMVVADPHAHEGALLTSLVRSLDDRAHVWALAAEADGWLARLVRRRLLLAGVSDLGLDVQIGVDLEGRLADPDVIVTRLPYQAGEERSLLSMFGSVQDIGDLLGPGRIALVVGPAAALIDAIPDADEAAVRARLLRSGVVEAVVNLPGGVMPYRPGYRCGLWVLSRDPIPAARGHVLIADIGSQSLDAGVRERLAEDILLWRAEGRRLDGHDPRYGRIVPVAELGRHFGDSLTPTQPSVSQLLSRTVAERPALIAEAEAQLASTSAQAQRFLAAHGPLRVEVIQRGPDAPKATTLGALLKARRVTKLKGNRLRPQDIGPEGHHAVLGHEEVRGDQPAGTRRIDRVVLFKAYQAAELTEPGDVVYTMAPRFSLMIDYDGFSVVVFPARILRVNPEARHPITPRVLAALLTTARGTGRSPTAVRAAKRVEDMVLPDLDTTDITRLDSLLADIDKRRRLLREQDEALDEICRLVTAGFADSSLTIEQPQTRPYEEREHHAPA